MIKHIFNRLLAKLWFNLNICFKSRFFYISYFVEEIHVTILKPAIYFIIKSDKSFKEMKEYENIEKDNGVYYLMHYSGKYALGEVVSYGDIRPHKFKIPFTGYTGASKIYKYKKYKDIYKLVIYTRTDEKCIPLTPIEFYKYIKNQKKG